MVPLVVTTIALRVWGSDLSLVVFMRSSEVDLQ